MAEPKTKRNTADVNAFLDKVEDDEKRGACYQFLGMMEDVTGAPPEMWGSSIVGFGSYHYVYASGKEGDWPLVGFSPRKRNLSLYIMSGFSHWDDLLSRLGKHKVGKSCLYINKIEDIDMAVLKELIEHSVAYMRDKYETKP